MGWHGCITTGAPGELGFGFSGGVEGPLSGVCVNLLPLPLFPVSIFPLSPAFHSSPSSLIFGIVYSFVLADTPALGGLRTIGPPPAFGEAGAAFGAYLICGLFFQTGTERLYGKK